MLIFINMNLEQKYELLKLFCFNNFIILISI